VRNGSTEFVLDGDQGARPDVGRALSNGTGSTFSFADDGPARRVRRTWLDTFDWRLYRAGLALEQVAGSGRTELVLTGRDGERLAVAQGSVAQGGVAPSGAANGNRGRAGWPALLGALPPGPLRELLEPVVGVRALAPVARATSQVRQQRVLNADAKTVARLAIDQMSVTYPGRAKAAPRLAVAAVRGYQAQASRLGAELAAAPGIRLAGGSALDAALAAAGTEPAPRVAELQLKAGMPAAVAMAAILTGLLDAIEDNVRGAIRDIDTEFLHDLRVAVRRTRSALKLAGRALPGELASRYGREFKWLGDLTTPTRDLDVYLLGFETMTAGLVGATSEDVSPFLHYLERTRATAHRELARTLRSARFARLTSQWRTELASVRAVRKRPAVAELASQRIAVAQRRALRAGQNITAASPAAELHYLRKRCKELRYLLEMFGSLYDPDQRWQAVRELKALQDCLGAFQDAEVQREEIHTFADRMLAERSAPAATLLAMGEIAADLARRQRKARMEFDDRFAAFAGQASQARLTALTQAAVT
jgi:CHAD domain-containing protein